MILKPTWRWLRRVIIKRLWGYGRALLLMLWPLVWTLLRAPAAWALASILVLWLISDRQYVLVASTVAVIGVAAVLWLAAGRTAIRTLVSAISAARR